MRFIALLLLFVAGPLFADDVRGHNWGDSLAVVKKSETAKFIDQDATHLLFTDTVGGISVNILYTFLDGRLVRAGYRNADTHTNKNDFIQDYRKLNELLTKKYGKPEVDKTVWRNELYKDDPSNFGMAISAGHLFYSAQWNLERTIILSVISGDKFKITHTVDYQEVASKKEQQQKQEQQELNKM
jgi:hypothetical protein